MEVSAQSATSVPALQDAEPVEARVLDTITVTGRRLPLSSFPGAVDVVDGESLREGQQRVSLSESISRVPGFTVRDRGNFAQDLQVQSRGFGARSTFGIRGIRLVADGVPLTAADGQSQAAGFALDTLDRIEVLRGPLALQYGNASGGAIIGYTELDQRDGVGVDTWADDKGGHRTAARSDGSHEAFDARWRMSGSHFQTKGERPHAAAERSHGVVHGEWKPVTSSRLRLTVNSLAQPWTEDPLGLTRAQWSADPHGGAPAAEAFDTRKRIANHQLGLRLDREPAAGRAWWVAAYGGPRGIEQFLAIPVGAQTSAGSAGGVVDVDRREGGLEVGQRWRDGRGSLAVGLELALLTEDRRGYENFSAGTLGVRGRLRRDEDNRVASQSAFLVGEHALGNHWHALGGIRHVRSRFESRDEFMAPGNGDDSGSTQYAESALSFGIARRFDRGEWFASLGRGFETPTVTELSYRPDGGAGLNLGLRPSSTRSVEAGVRWRAPGRKTGATVYRIEGRDEIVAAASIGGRASFANAGSTRREGLELGVEGTWNPRWRYALAANWLRASFTEGFAYQVFSDGALQTRRVATGNRLPGIPQADAFVEVAWNSQDGRLGVATELRLSDRVFVDDRNSDAAPGHSLLALRGTWGQSSAGWQAFARIDNLLDQDYVGSVIVNEGNGRFFEPGAGRTITLGLGWRSP